MYQTANTLLLDQTRKALRRLQTSSKAANVTKLSLFLLLTTIFQVNLG